MKFLFASDSFKGSLTSEQQIDILTEAANDIFPDCECKGVPIADGGEGTVAAVTAVTGGDIRRVAVHGPLMEETTASYGIFNGDHAIIEMAAASGLPMVPEDLRDPLNTTTFGTGELIKDALGRGVRDISVAIGGSATNDGGMGAMRALGIRFLDAEGNELAGTGADLEKVENIDISGLDPAITGTKVTVMCDVRNPLTGPDGATYTFGPQKGGTPETLDRLERGMKHYADIMRDKLGQDVENVAGAGAAGGLGAALCAYLGADMRSGIETVLDLIGFDELLNGVDLVITGEGRMDWQSAFGKVPSGVGQCCKEKGVPAVAIVGGMGKGAENIYDYGIESIVTTINAAMDMDEACSRAAELYKNAAERTFRLFRAGQNAAK